MKLTIVLITACLLHASAKVVSQHVSFSGKQVRLEAVFSSIERQTDFIFIYTEATLKQAKPVTIHLQNVSVEALLNEVFKSQPLKYSIRAKNILVSPKAERKIDGSPLPNDMPDPLQAPPVDLKGKVVNDKGEPVQGVTVKIKGTAKLTTTDANGEFLIVSDEKSAVLVFTHVSMEPFELRTNGGSDLVISLKTKVSALEDVTVSVNTGYQKISKERFVGSVSTLDSAAYSRRAGMDIIGRLDGTVTGLLFDKKEGTLISPKIQIRGLSTLNGLQQSANPEPLIILDNFPYKQDLGSINPNDVETITVLKDAAAASIWGAQAGNGVIIITTKKGRYNQPFHVTTSSNVTIQEKPDLYHFPQMSSSDFIDAEIFLFGKGYYDANLTNYNSWPVISPVVEILNKKRNGSISAFDSATEIDALRNIDVRRDLLKYAYRNPVLQQHYINLSGGSSIYNYSLSGGFNSNLNNVRNSQPDMQYSVNANAGMRPVKNLEVTTVINYSQGIQQAANFSLPGQVYPYAQLADVEGASLAIPNARRLAYTDTAGVGNLLDWGFRPLDEPGLTDSRNINRSILLNLGISYRFTNWLNLSLGYQYVSQTSNSRSYYSTETWFTRDLINQFTNLSQSSAALRNPVPQGGILDIRNTALTGQNARAQLNFNKSINRLHEISALIAGEFSENKVEASSGRFYGYNKATGAYAPSMDYTSSFPLYMGTSGLQRVPNGNEVLPEIVNRFVSLLSNASYTYNSRYTLYASARKDGSNVFGVNTNRKWKPLWSLGASWDITKENFVKVKWLQLLRARFSYGFTGNPGNASGLPTVKYSSGLAKITNLIMASPGDPPNPDLRWEKVRIINGGLDFAVLDNRITGSIELWKKNSMDVISLIPFAPSTGTTTFVVNAANLQGKGFDVRISSRNTKGAFTWQTVLGISYAKTIVTKLFNSPKSAKDYIAYDLHPAEGRVVYGMSSYRWAGLDPLTGDPRGYYQKQVSTDYNAIMNDSVGNQVFHGSAIPLYFGNIMNSLNWKNFTLSANISYRFDFYFRRPAIDYDKLAKNWRGHADYAARWQKPGDEKYTTVPSFSFPVNALRDVFYQDAEINALRGDNIRLADLRLQYNIDNRAHTKWLFKNFQLYAYANNLNIILWRKNTSNLDPDFVGSTNFTAPTPKTWTLGMSLNF